ncbi:transposase [Pandoraea vervacti]|uniref:transposase n=1 Tax=Pandoraea vervacti TaxID=656178 RepID=UPI000933A041
MGNASTRRDAEKVAPGNIFSPTLTRKSAEPMAAHLSPQHARAIHHSLYHFVEEAQWSDAEVMRRVRERVLPSQSVLPVRRAFTGS